VLVVGGCGSDTVWIDVPDLDGADAAACADLVAALPDTLGGEARREVDPDDAPGAAWGDPAYVLTCGVPRPEDVPQDALCNDIGGVGWYLPDDELRDLREDVTATALTHTPYVSLEVPSRYRTEGLDAALAELAPVLREHLAEGESCL
jgi:hypothetical protein